VKDVDPSSEKPTKTVPHVPNAVFGRGIQTTWHEGRLHISHPPPSRSLASDIIEERCVRGPLIAELGSVWGAVGLVVPCAVARPFQLWRRAATIAAVTLLAMAWPSACAGQRSDPAPSTNRHSTGPATSQRGVPPATRPAGLPVFDDDPCGKAPPPVTDEYAELFRRWADEEAAAPIEPGRVVVIGSSSIRLWSSLQEQFTAWAPVQRGFGGALLWDVAAEADRLISVHHPSAVVVYAGANDLDDHASAESTFDAYRCLLQRIRTGAGDVPVAMITVTPTPLRWDAWPEAEKFNRLVIELSRQWPSLHVVDGQAAYLATGAPPAERLFLPDRLHLNATGYALWNDQAHAALDTIITGMIAPSVTVDRGRYAVDFGSTTEPSLPSESRTVVTFPAAGALTPGEQWRLVDATGRPGPRLVVADWNMTPTPDRRALYVRPSSFAHLTLEGVAPGTKVTATLRLADAAGASLTVSAVADDQAWVHLHLRGTDDPLLQVTGIDLVLGG
jgi:hypothetical protein